MHELSGSNLQLWIATTRHMIVILLSNLLLHCDSARFSSCVSNIHPMESADT